MSTDLPRRRKYKDTLEHGKLALRSEAPSEPEYMALFERETRFAGRYRVLETLGRGGMGEVVLCADKVTRRNVAVKRLDRSRTDKSQRERFLREARIQAQLDHPTIVPVHDIGIDDEGMEYFTMKRVSGLTLEQIIEQVADDVPGMRERFSLNTRLGIFRQVCLGVEYAHEHGIIHRDLKPANVIVGDFGEVHVIDWGIAKVVSSGQSPESGLRLSTTGRGVGLGTPGYMPPEQLFEADSVDPRADVYALGAMLFELITLQLLYPEAHTDDVLAATQRGANANMTERAPGLDVPPEFEQVCVRATAKLREDRLSSVGELSEVVGRYLDGDRDLELRRTLAARHADEAARIYREVAASSSMETGARQRVLREAGHALALDPRSSSAIDMVTRMMSQLPAQMPPEVHAMYADDEERFEVEARKRGLIAYALHLPLWLLFFFFDVSNWIAVAFIFVPLLVAMAVAAVRSSTWKHKPPVLVALGSVLVTIAATSSVAGPYLVMPSYIVAFGVLSLAVAKGGFHRPLLWVSMCVAAFLVPVALELSGILPAGVTFEPSRIVVDMHLISVSPSLLRAALIGMTLVSILAPMGFAYRMAARQRETRLQLFFQMWHLQNLAPTSVAQR